MQLKLLRCVAVSVFLAACTSAPVDISSPTYPDNPQALANAWYDTLVVFPNEPQNYLTRAGRNLTPAVERFKPSKLPALIFLHGSTGLAVGSTQTTQMIRSFAEAGFVVFAPNSLDRPRMPYGNASTLTIVPEATAIKQRVAELESTLRHIRELPWIDQENLFLAGHSMGATAAAQYRGTAFKAIALLGTNCQEIIVWNAAQGVAAPS